MTWHVPWLSSGIHVICDNDMLIFLHRRRAGVAAGGDAFVGHDGRVKTPSSTESCGVALTRDNRGLVFRLSVSR